MKLCYDVVKIILKIKYNNWCLLKRCVCGKDDFKNCNTLECSKCSEVYCLNHWKSDEWIWCCASCEEFYCGYHEYIKDRHGRPFCLFCYKRKFYLKDSKSKAPSLSTVQRKMLHITNQKKALEWRRTHEAEVRALESPELDQ